MSCAFLDAGDDDAAARVYATLLPLPDGRELPVGSWTMSNLAVVRARAAGVRQ